ncbi:conjugative transposon protein TraM [Salegentibacter sp. JZCK2]|uniref:conjugative transposon protein TraM n=1 Tax=Salegentibacter tibetensis TaxID=2873600 RepID=UPI001CCA0F53|nr:conjugative transposon protein TraM [Salegentibacter tibetensis]MBZ9730751.1 conjugative transposon protein TraM [Salegentibacter tibetensis]
MKIEKNKIVFISVLVVIVVFLITYTLIITGGDEQEQENLRQTEVPALEEESQETYGSKLEAIDDLKEVREKNAPSIYDEKLIDSLGYYDTELLEKEKERKIDSIYELGQTRYEQITKIPSPPESNSPTQTKRPSKSDTTENRETQKIEAKEMGLEHQLFFASAPKKSEPDITGATDKEIKVVVDGTQVIKANSRLRMRLARPARIGVKLIPKNTPVFGFVSFQPNRVLIEIQNINNHPSSLKAFDLEDGSEGIYIENNFRAEVTTEVLDDVISDINIPSVPQVSGISKVFRRNNRNVKVTILNNYRLILKADKPGINWGTANQ